MGTGKMVKSRYTHTGSKICCLYRTITYSLTELWMWVRTTKRRN